MTSTLEEPDVTALNALSRVLLRQISRLEAALDATQDPAVESLVIYAQATREEILQRIEGRLRHLGRPPEPILLASGAGRPANGASTAAESAIDEVARGEAELCIALRRGVQDQTLMPHTRHFLRDLMDRVTATAERYGRRP